MPNLFYIDIQLCSRPTCRFESNTFLQVFEYENECIKHSKFEII